MEEVLLLRLLKKLSRFTSIKSKESKVNKQLDRPLILFTFLLYIIGIIAIYTASVSKIGDELIFSDYYQKQIVWGVLSLFISIIIIKLPYHIFEVMIFPLYIFSILLLILVLFTPEINGSHRWLQFGSFRIQPSEPAKILTILAISHLICNPNLSDFKILLRSSIIFIIPVFFILLEPDLGTTLLYGTFLLGILSFSRLQKYYIVILISPIFSILTAFHWPFYLLIAVSLIFILNRFKLTYVYIALIVTVNTFIFFITPVLWNSLKEYQQNRILTFLDPSRDPLGAGYQIIQSKIAIGSGEIFGKGFLEGTQKNLNFLPEHHTDFIFSVIGEEFGFLGTSLVIGIYALFLYRIIRLIFEINSYENRISAIGILFYLTFQIFINIGMNIGVVPTTGITLPFISYGGSSLLINSMAVAIILKYNKGREY